MCLQSENLQFLEASFISQNAERISIFFMFDISRSRVPGESIISIFFSTEYKEEIEVV